jgi:MFS family permease
VQRFLDRLGFPSFASHRRFVTAIAVDAVGSGVFMPVCVLYFLVTTDLSLVQVGAAISLASAVALPVGPLLGGVVDRYGAKHVLLAGNVLQCVGFAAYLVTDSFVGLTLWTVVVTVGRTAFWGSYGNIVAAISVPGEREKWFGFLGALRNVGFAVGGLVSGLVITIGTPTAYAAVVVANAVSYAVAFGLLLAVPATPRTGHRAAAGAWGVVLRDRPYRLLWAAQLAYSTSMMVLNFAMPVYATTVLHLPGWVTGAVFTLNTVMVGFGQGLAVRAMTGAVRWRVLLLANGVRDLHVRGGARRSGARRPVRRGGARPPARTLPVAHPARLEPGRDRRAGDLRVAAHRWGRPDLARPAGGVPGGRPAGDPARRRSPAGRAAGHEPRRGPGRRLRRRDRGRLGRTTPDRWCWPSPGNSVYSRELL